MMMTSPALQISGSATYLPTLNFLKNKYNIFTRNNRSYFNYYLKYQFNSKLPVFINIIEQNKIINQLIISYKYKI